MREFTSRDPSSIDSCPPEISFQTEFDGVRSARAWSTYAISTVSPTRSTPASGSSSPTIIRKSVVLPAPFGPTMPTMPPGGSEKERSSNRSLSPKPLASLSAATTRSPTRGPAGM